MNVNRRTILSGFGAVGVAAAGKAIHLGSGSRGNSSKASLRIAHASPDTPPVDVYVNEKKIIQKLHFREVTKYRHIVPENHQFRITAAGDPDTVIFSVEKQLKPGKHTILAFGERTAPGSNFHLKFLSDETKSNLRTGNACIRAVHASPDAGSLDITTTDTGVPLFNDISYGDVEEGTVQSEKTDIEVVTGDSKQTSQLQFTLSLHPRAFYTMIITGYQTPNHEAAEESFGAVIAQDDSGPKGETHTRLSIVSDTSSQISGSSSNQSSSTSSTTYSSSTSSSHSVSYSRNTSRSTSSSNTPGSATGDGLEIDVICDGNQGNIVDCPFDL